MGRLNHFLLHFLEWFPVTVTNVLPLHHRVHIPPLSYFYPNIFPFSSILLADFETIPISNSYLVIRIVGGCIAKVTDRKIASRKLSSFNNLFSFVRSFPRISCLTNLIDKQIGIPLCPDEWKITPSLENNVSDKFWEKINNQAQNKQTSFQPFFLDILILSTHITIDNQLNFILK